MPLSFGCDGFDKPGRDELTKGGLGYADMASESGKANAPLGDQTTRKALGCPEHFGGFRHHK
jgi:hypothetical protein